MKSRRIVLRPDDVAEQFPEGSIKLFTKILSATPDHHAPGLLIEGDATSLEYLGRVLLAQATDPLDCGYELSPNAGGQGLFDKRAKARIYIHRTPCMDLALEAAAVRKKGRASKATKNNPRANATSAKFPRPTSHQRDKLH